MNSSEEINEYIINKLKKRQNQVYMIRSTRKCLENLNLSGNKIEILNSLEFPGENLLKDINLENNLIEKIDQNFFINLRCLENLNLSGNKIESLKDLSFPDENLLRQLNLENNLIEKIENYFINNLNGLENLNLSVFRKETYSDN
ncbi:leucine Rich repeat-containing domain [Brachionus plicatilis]|uniref:Leucine Rich repeat-containing domain n=1 Tax=Brachionus plicatilis TaxID=10195 RepID=A0A3M7PIF1_BRAPC|nr:leucine Rich repeat-containing domain [Brachionus plicatilis]